MTVDSSRRLPPFPRFPAWALAVVLALAAGCGELQPPPTAPEPPPPPSPPPRPQVQTQEPAAKQVAEDVPEDVPGDERIEAAPGVGAQGRSYAGGIITEPLRQRFLLEHRLVFEASIPKAMQLFEANHGRKPNSHEEFMEKIILAEEITLPPLPEGQLYLYVPKDGKLYVFSD